MSSKFLSFADAKLESSCGFISKKKTMNHEKSSKRESKPLFKITKALSTCSNEEPIGSFENQIKLIKNRISAKKSREKRRKYVECIEERALEVEKENLMLKFQIDILMQGQCNSLS